MRKGHWRRYPVRRDGSRRVGYYWVREAHVIPERTELDDRGTVVSDVGEFGNEEKAEVVPLRDWHLPCWLRDSDLRT